MPGPGSVSRRRFLETGATTAAVTIVARHVLGGPRFVPPSDRINVAYVGAGTQGLRQLMPALQRPELRIVAVCDPNRRSENYIEWSRFELRDKIRHFLGDSRWAAGARACPCGREVGRELVDRHYGAARRRGLPRLHGLSRADREREGSRRGLLMTPDHLHAAVSLAGLRAGKHVITHKPLANVMSEARLVIQTRPRDGRRHAHVLQRGPRVDRRPLRVDLGRSDRPRARGAQLVGAAVLAAGHDRASERKRCRYPRGSTGTCGSGPCRTARTIPPTRTPSSGAGTTSGRAPSATWATTASSRSSGS